MNYYDRLSRINQGSPFAGNEGISYPQSPRQEPEYNRINALEMMQQQQQQQAQPLDMPQPRQSALPMPNPVQMVQRQQQQQQPAPIPQSHSGGGGGGELQGLVSSIAKKNGVKSDLINAIIKQESNFNPNAKSHAGAAGLMQLMPRTAQSLGVKNSYDPQQNVDGGSKYIKQMLTKYPDVRMALAAYNWGPGNMDKAIKKYGNNFDKIQQHMPKETREYVPKVLGNMGM